MILAFHPQFHHLITSGQKKCTIRRGHRWRIGASIQFYTGRYTSGARRKFHPDAKVFNVENVEIMVASKTIIVNGQTLDPTQIESLAQKDGFPNTASFFEYFTKSLPKGTNNFTGQIIHWQ